MLFQIRAALVISNWGRFITNWGRFISNQGSFSYFKLGQIYYKLGQVFQIGADLFQIGAIISNRCRTVSWKKVSRRECNTEDYNDTDDYGHTIKKDQKHLEIVVLVVLFFLRERNNGSDKTCKLAAKRAFFSKESIVFPFIQM